MIVYIDDDFKCHADPADDREQVETDMIADGWFSGTKSATYYW